MHYEVLFTYYSMQQQLLQITIGNTSYLIRGRIISSSEARTVNDHYVMIVDRKRTNKSKLWIVICCHFSAHSKNSFLSEKFLDVHDLEMRISDVRRNEINAHPNAQSYLNSIDLDSFYLSTGASLRITLGVAKNNNPTHVPGVCEGAFSHKWNPMFLVTRVLKLLNTWPKFL